MNVGSSSYANNIVYATAGTPEIIIGSGALNVYSQIRRGTVNTSGSLNYTQTGGTVTVYGKNPATTTRGMFEVQNTGSKFVMSGGTLILANGGVVTSSPYDFDLEPDSYNVTGGTIKFGLSSVTTANTLFYFQASCPFWNLTLDTTTNASAIQEILNSTILGNLTIGGTIELL